MTNVETRNAQPAKSRDRAIDYQPAMYQGVQSDDRLVTFNNVQVLAKAAKLFGGPHDYHDGSAEHTLRTIHAGDTSLFPEHTVIDRTSTNSCLTRERLPQALNPRHEKRQKLIQHFLTIISLARRAESERDSELRGAMRTAYPSRRPATAQPRLAQAARRPRRAYLEGALKWQKP
jgi:hypothetical protein